MDEVRILATCSLGLGFSYQGFQLGLQRDPHMIGADAGSSDFGPYYLGTGILQKSPLALRRDLQIMLEGALKLGVPLLIGSAGGAGANPHLDAVLDLVRQIASKRSLHFRLASIRAQLDNETLQRKLQQGRVQPLGPVPPLTAAGLTRTRAAVGMMGVEPFIAALRQGADVVIAGRSTDPAIFRGVPRRGGLPAGPAWHAAKSVDKGYLATTDPKEGSPILATVRPDHFIMEPTKPGTFCTVQSVASLTLHENPDPFRVTQPTGTIDTTSAVYEQIDEARVKVSGSVYTRSPQPTIKVEGAEEVGFRVLMLAGIRDPRVLERLDLFLDTYRKTLERTARSLDLAPDDYQVNFRVYGRDAVLGEREPARDLVPHEVGLVVDVVGRTEEIAGAVATKLGPTGSRLDVIGNQGGGGNFAYPFSPSVIKVGPVFQWSIWHTIEVEELELTSLFPITFETL